MVISCPTFFSSCVDTMYDVVERSDVIIDVLRDEFAVTQRATRPGALRTQLDEREDRQR